MKDEKISVPTKLIRVEKDAAAWAEYNKGRGGDSVLRFVSDAIREKWERDNVGKTLVIRDGKVVEISRFTHELGE